ncbi:hypothetical protein SAMN05428967_3366 [Phyllobacterium sp. YR620]|nr:hypothetical protein SAMN05428967_3366 [Phyllobacterium sp. YR620]
MAVGATECELWANRAWVAVTIEDVLSKFNGRIMRCMECHGSVRPHKEGVNGSVAHFEHKDAHRGCSFSISFDGTRRVHPKPVRV